MYLDSNVNKAESRKASDSPTLATSAIDDQTENHESYDEPLTLYALHVEKSFESLVKPRSLSYSAATARN